ncbi:MAG: Hpt domain-containing protein, partial [Treponema sp.]|nr:Hpt domain-containing protein [Treponema sp.]
NSVLNRLIRDKQPPEVIEAARQQKEEKKDFYALHPQLDSLLLESFIRDARKTIVWIEEKHSNLASEEVLRMFTVIVHGIKSSLSNIGETVLAELAYKLEKSGREQDIGQIKASLPGFLNDLRALLEKLEAKNNKYDTAEDNEDLCQKLMEIQERAADYDRKGALDMITEIKHCSKETKAVLDNIMERVLHSEFEEAENAAAAHMVALTLANTQNEARLLEKEIKGLNIIKGLQRYGCDEKTYLKVLRSYAASVRSMLGIIESFSSPERSEAVTPDKLNDYKIKVHGIKGTSLDIFAGQIGTSAKALEDAAKTDNIEYINDHNSAFLEAAWKMVTDIESLLMGLDAENPKPKKDRPDKEELSKLLAACKNYDMDGADNAMAEIEKFQYESDDGLADWLRESLDRMDLKQIADKLGGA